MATVLKDIRLALGSMMNVQPIVTPTNRKGKRKGKQFI